MRDADDLRRQLERALERVLPGEDVPPPALHRAMRYAVFSGGKRLRPLLLLRAVEALGGDVQDALGFACALELIHTYSLIHDDLPAMDDSPLRRGRPTVHRAFGEAVAILAGDALLTLAFQLMAERAGSPRAALAMREIARGTLCMARGQSLELELEGAGTWPAPDQLEDLYAQKTGGLFVAAVRAGAALAGAGPGELAALDAYGRALGLAFQIADDIQDLHSDPARKPTYPRLRGLVAARGRVLTLIEEALRALEALGERAAALREVALQVRQKVEVETWSSNGAASPRR